LHSREIAEGQPGDGTAVAQNPRHIHGKDHFARCEKSSQINDDLISRQHRKSLPPVQRAVAVQHRDQIHRQTALDRLSVKFDNAPIVCDKEHVGSGEQGRQRCVDQDFDHALSQLIDPILGDRQPLTPFRRRIVAQTDAILFRRRMAERTDAVRQDHGLVDLRQLPGQGVDRRLTK